MCALLGIMVLLGTAGADDGPKAKVKGDFEAFFKIRFGRAENWLKHYVVAYTWANKNAHPWIFRVLVFVVDHLPFRERLLIRFPFLSIYFDIARTFGGLPAEGGQAPVYVSLRYLF